MTCLWSNGAYRGLPWTPSKTIFFFIFFFSLKFFPLPKKRKRVFPPGQEEEGKKKAAGKMKRALVDYKGAARVRTETCITNQLLYQLSYAGNNARSVA